MKTALPALVILSSLLALPAFAGECVFGKDNYGRPATFLDGQMIDYYGSSQDAINALSKLREGGHCSNRPTACTYGKDNYGRPAAFLNGNMLDYFGTSQEALNAIAKLREEGNCSTRPSACTYGKDNYGRPAAFLNGVMVDYYGTWREAIAALAKLRNAGQCGDSRHDRGDRGEHRLSATCEMRGNSVFLDNKLVDSYSNGDTARAVLLALDKVGVCDIR